MTPSAQDLFDTAFTAIIKQGKPCRDPQGTCYYIHPSIPNLRCAIGHLVSEGQAYDWNLNGRITDILNAHDLADEYHYLWEYMDLLNDIQEAHDYALEPFIPTFIARMRSIASRYHLTFKETP